MKMRALPTTLQEAFREQVASDLDIVAGIASARGGVSVAEAKRRIRSRMEGELGPPQNLVCLKKHHRWLQMLELEIRGGREMVPAWLMPAWPMRRKRRR